MKVETTSETSSVDVAGEVKSSHYFWECQKQITQDMYGATSSTAVIIMVMVAVIIDGHGLGIDTRHGN